MKNRKIFLTPLFLAPVVLTTGCGGGINPLDQIFNYIEGPTEKAPTSLQGKPFKKALEESEFQEAEMYYDLFGFFNTKGWYDLEDDDSLTSLYKENVTSLSARIAKSESFFEDEKFYVTFFGYVRFTFIKDYLSSKGDIVYKAGNYFTITYSIQRFAPVFDNDKCSLKYVVDDNSEDEAFGILEIQQWDLLPKIYSIDTIDTSSFSAKNCQNWTK